MNIRFLPSRICAKICNTIRSPKVVRKNPTTRRGPPRKSAKLKVPRTKKEEKVAPATCTTCSAERSLCRASCASCRGSSSAELRRVLLIFQLYGEIRDGFQQTSSKADFDNGIKSKYFWEEDVAKFFNDSNFKASVSLSPALEDVTLSKPPAHERNESFLGNLLRNCQPHWEEVEEGGFRVSGKNCADFETDLTEVRKINVLSAIGQMLLLCGEIFRIGSPHGDNDLLELLSRKSTALGNEGGLQRRLPGYVMTKQEKSPGSRKQNQASLDNASVAFTDLCDSVKRSFAETNSGEATWDFNTESDMLKALSEAEKYENDLSLSDKLRKRWQYHYDRKEADVDRRSPVKQKPAGNDS